MKKLLLPLLFFAVVTSCDDNESALVPASDGTIQYGVTEQELDQSRASEPGALVLTGGSDSLQCAYSSEPMASALVSRGAPQTAISDFNIYSFYYPAAEATTPQSFLFRQEQAVLTDAANGIWTTANRYYWPTNAGSTLSFWAISPCDASGVSVRASAPDPSAMAVEYRVPAYATEQPDIMLAVTDRVNGKDDPSYRVPLQFRHICAAVRFVTGDMMQPGTIKSITLAGINSRATYNTDGWSPAADRASFTIEPDLAVEGTTAPGTALGSTEATLMMIPQSFDTDDATLTVVLADDVTGTERTLSASLKGQQWRQGMITTYKIGIADGLDISFAPVGEQDAHYVMAPGTLNVANLRADRGWTLTATASDGADVTIQHDADMDPLCKQGFWLDKNITNRDVTKPGASARGTAYITGTGPGTFPYTVFLPENVSGATREIKLTLTVDGTGISRTATLRQASPLRGADGTLWELYDDGINSIYGYQYTAIHTYFYNNSQTSVYSWNSLANTVNDLISRFFGTPPAVDVTHARFHYSTGALGIRNYRYYVSIDYSQFNNLGNIAQSPSDGRANTLALYNFGGSAISSSFEEAILNITRREGFQTVIAFRARDNNYSIDNAVGDRAPAWIEGQELKRSQAIVAVLKKNRYYRNTSNLAGDAWTVAPYIPESDIKWYIPAYEQFAGVPPTPVDSAAFATDRAAFWSSTAAGSTSYLGSGTAAPRTTAKSIRAARNP